MKTKLLVLIFYLISLSSCYAARMDGPYEGRVVDAETSKPIEGVVVLGTWHSITVTPGGGVSNYYDAQETVTDKNGEFKVKGIGLLVLNNIPEPDIKVFKAGYEYSGLFWIPGEVPLYSKIKWEGRKVIIPLKKLSMEERKKQGSPDYPSRAPAERIQFMLREINKDRIERGLEPVN
jgi:hypothetical protein